MIEQAQRILGFGSKAVLLKGGHAWGEEAVDILVTASDAPVRLCAARVGGALRGTGCALSSAIAANLALQVPLIPACERAKAYVWSLFQQAAH
jgi:hydroxymethylpyrimidine/phosphomethylpyrimidine kinase